MEYIIVSLAALFVSLLTLFSGFGLGTILMPVFALFFPIDIAVALTAIVHLLNNLFKLAILGRYADKTVALQFGLPAILASLLGAWLLLRLSDMRPLISYQIFNSEFEVMPVKLVIGMIIVFFSLFEIHPRLKRITFERKYLKAGGILSGFFGGLSGHQGALRSAFILKCGLSKESFISTGVVIACLVDVARISVYGSHITSSVFNSNGPLLTAAVLSAFLGTYIGSRLLNKITMRTVQAIVTIMLFGIAAGLATGMI